MNKLELIYNRKSVRSYKADPVPMTDIEQIIKAATYAPSGNNLQTWHFVVIRNQDKIAEIVQAVQQKNAQLSEFVAEDKRQAFKAKVNYHTVFKSAPVLVLVYAGPYPSLADDLEAAGIMNPEDITSYRRSNPAIQNIAAAMENLLLAAAAMGYGTCWMTGPTYAAEEISEIIGFNKPGYSLAAMTPLGVPTEGKYANPPRKPLAEVLTVIE